MAGGFARMLEEVAAQSVFGDAAMFRHLSDRPIGLSRQFWPVLDLIEFGIHCLRLVEPRNTRRTRNGEGTLGGTHGVTRPINTALYLFRVFCVFRGCNKFMRVSSGFIFKVGCHEIHTSHEMGNAPSSSAQLTSNRARHLIRPLATFSPKRRRKSP
jgi:hypothetical protein